MELLHVEAYTVHCSVTQWENFVRYPALADGPHPRIATVRN